MDKSRLRGKVISVLAGSLLSFVAGGCQTPLLRANDSDLKVPEPFPPPYVETYRRGSDELCFIAARHQAGFGSTHVAIDRVWASFEPSLAVLEGFPADLGENPARESPRTARCMDVQSKKCDEGSYAMRMAVSKHIPFEGGEPSEAVILNGVKARGYSTKDLLGFYVVRQVPQWKREETLSEVELPNRIDRFIHSYAKVFGEKTDFDSRKFRAWFIAKTGQEFAAAKITSEDPAPSSGPGTTEINAISRVVETIRNTYLVEELARMVSRYHKVVVIYGQGHLAETRSRLRDLFGPSVETKKYESPEGK